MQAWTGRTKLQHHLRFKKNSLLFLKIVGVSKTEPVCTQLSDGRVVAELMPDRACKSTKALV